MVDGSDSPPPNVLNAECGRPNQSRRVQFAATLVATPNKVGKAGPFCLPLSRLQLRLHMQRRSRPTLTRTRASQPPRSWPVAPSPLPAQPPEPPASP
eukprot:355285-Chlamydomonas_euryale.AAC.7